MTKRTRRSTDPTRDRLVFSVLHELRGLKPSEISNFTKQNSDLTRSTVSPATIRRWRKAPKDGGTRYPTAIKLDAALSIVGKKLGIVNDNKD